MTEHQAGLDGTPPLVYLQRERSLDVLPFGYTEPAFVAEGDRTRARASGLNCEAGVFAFPHRAHVA